MRFVYMKAYSGYVVSTDQIIYDNLLQRSCLTNKLIVGKDNFCSFITEARLVKANICLTLRGMQIT